MALLDRVAKRAREIYYQRNPAPGLLPWEKIGYAEQNAWKPHAQAAIEAVAEICKHDLMEKTGE